MSAASPFKSLQLRFFSKPKHNRALYRAVRKLKPTTIVELGVADARRSTNLIRLAQRYSPETEIGYTGVDLFEAREVEQPGLTLKHAHQTLKATDAKVRLVPGDPFSAMARTANCLVGTHLLVVGLDQDPESLDRAWFYIPRILTPESLIFWEQPAESEDTEHFHTRLSVDQVQGLAGQNVRRAA